MIFSSQQLALQPPGARLAWNVFDDGLIAGDYRIHLVGPHLFELTFRGRHLSVERTVTGAYIAAEQHRGESLLHGVRRRYASMVVVALVAWFVVDLTVRSTDAGWMLLLMLPAVFFLFNGAFGLLTTLGNDVNGRYR